MRKKTGLKLTMLLQYFVLAAVIFGAQSVYATTEVLYFPSDFPDTSCAFSLTLNRPSCPEGVTQQSQSFCSKNLKGLDIILDMLGQETCSGEHRESSLEAASLAMVWLVDDLNGSGELLDKFGGSAQDTEYGRMIVPSVKSFIDSQGRLYHPVFVVGEAMFDKGEDSGKEFTDETWRWYIEDMVNAALKDEQEGSTEERPAASTDNSTDSQQQSSGNVSDQEQEDTSAGSSAASTDDSTSSQQQQRRAGESGTVTERRTITVPYSPARDTFLKRIRNKIDDWMVRARAEAFVFESDELGDTHEMLLNDGIVSGTNVRLRVIIERRRSDRRVEDVRFEFEEAGITGQQRDSTQDCRSFAENVRIEILRDYPIRPIPHIEETDIHYEYTNRLNAYRDVMYMHIRGSPDEIDVYRERVEESRPGSMQGIDDANNVWGRITRTQRDQVVNHAACEIIFEWDARGTHYSNMLPVKKYLIIRLDNMVAVTSSAIGGRPPEHLVRLIESTWNGTLNRYDPVAYLAFPNTIN